MRIAVGDLLPEERSGFHEQKGDRRAYTRAWDNCAVKGGQTKEALRRHNRQSRAEQRYLRVGPDRLDFTPKLERMFASDIGEVLRGLEVLFLVQVNTTHKTAGFDQVWNLECRFKTRPLRIQVEVAPAVLEQGLR